MIIAFANTKGGVAKTTSAILTAIALSADHEVLVLDADPQGSASQWALSAADAGTPLPFEVQPVNHAILRRLKATEGKITIIDTPPNDASIIEMIAKIADLTVVPTATSGLDLARTWETYSALEGLPRAVLVTAAEKQTLLHQEAILALEEQGIARFRSVIPKRQGIKHAYGNLVKDLHGYEIFAKELLEAVK